MVISQQRYEEIKQRNLNRYDLVILYTGIYPWENTLEVINREFSAMLKKKIYVLSRYNRDLYFNYKQGFLWIDLNFNNTISFNIEKEPSYYK